MFTFYHTLAIAAIVKNEAPYILEWLSYHRAAGVTKFYIYDNGSTDGTVDLLQNFTENGEVELINCPLEAGQLQAYQDAIERARFACKYLAVIDADEFLLSTEGKKLPDAVDDFMKKNPGVAGLAARWRCVGSSGEKEYRPEEVTKRFCYRGEDDFPPNTHIKSIFNPRLADYMPNPHSAIYFWRHCLVSSSGDAVPSAYMDKTADELIYTYHYFVKSEEEFMAKQRRGTADGTAERNLEDFALYDRNEVFDDSVWQYFRKMQVIPRHEKKKETIDRINELRLQEIIAGSKTGLTESLCFFFNEFSKENNDRIDNKKQIVDLIYEIISGDEQLPVEQVMLFADVLPEFLCYLRTMQGEISADWKRAINDLLSNAIYVARTFYQIQEVKKLRYIKRMLLLVGDGGWSG